MNDFQNDPNNADDGMDNSNPPNSKKRRVLLELLIGVGISAAAYILIGTLTFAKGPAAVTALVDFIILAVFVFLVVKFFRTEHTTAAIVMLILIVPAIFALLLLGACMLTFAPHL